MAPGELKHILGHMRGSLSDEEVVSRCLAGDPDSFAVIVRRYQSRLLRLAAGALADRATAQDVVQETFIRVYTRLSRYKPQKSFSAWLYTIFSNRLKDQLRRRQRHGGFLRRLVDHYRHEQAIAEPETPPPDTTWIRPGLARLAKMQRLCVLLRDIEQIDISAIASRLGISQATVRVHLMRGRRKLREIYEREIRKD